MSKNFLVSLLTFTTIVAFASHPVSAQDQTTTRRPDQAEFETETQVRLTPLHVTVAEVTEATPSSSSSRSQTWWDYLHQSLSAFIQAIRAIFNSKL